VIPTTESWSRRRPATTPGVRLKPPLKWAGGKRWLVPLLKTLWEPHRESRLVEPLCGGLAVALGLLPGRALLNDVNPHAINFYRWLQKGLRPKLAMVNECASFYACRQRFNDSIAAGRDATREAAELFYYLNRTGYNGLCRFNSKGLFNVPFGRYRTIDYARDFSPYRPLFAGWKFACGDFESLPLRPGDFVYADPPYDVEFTTYSKGGFRWEDQVRLAAWLKAHEGPVVLSNQATARIVRLYEGAGFRLQFFDAPRRISCTGDRTPAREVLALRNL